MERRAIVIASLLLLFTSASVSGANWYVDPEATGAATGTNWENAWTIVDTTQWASVAAGDTIYLSGGTTSKTYTNSILFPSGKNGTAAAWIRVAVGQDAGHNGTVVFDNCRLAAHYNSHYIWLDGAKDPSFTAPTNHNQILTGSTAITNNIGIRIQNLFGSENSDTDPVLWYYAGATPNNHRYSYIEVYCLTNSFAETNQGYGWKGSVCYINFPTGNATNIVWEYCYLRDNASQQFGGGTYDDGAFDQWTFKFGIISGQGEDTFEVGGGWTIRDSIIGPANCWVVGGGKVHEDHFQITGDYTKIYNNIIWPAENSLMRLQTSPDASRNDFYFFNNLILEIPGTSPDGGTLVEPMCFVHFDPSHPGLWATYSNIVIANNLFYGSIPNTAQGYEEMSRGAIISWSKGAITNCDIKHCLFANNIVFDKEKGTGFPHTSTYEDFTTNDFLMDYNVFCNTNGTLTTPRRIVYLDVATNAESLGIYQFQNVTNVPSFLDPAAVDFDLQLSDTTALDTGTNLSSIFNFDSLNRPRNVRGAWDRGPLELQETNLIVWLRFEESDWSSGHYVFDSSGYANHGWRRGRTNGLGGWQINTTNWPSRVAANTTPGVNSNGYCSQFAWTVDSVYSEYNREGQYYGLTNSAALTNLTQATIAFWGRHEAAYSGTYLNAHNAAFISAGTSGHATSPSGGWDIARTTSPETRFNVLTNQWSESRRGYGFPDYPTPYTDWNGDTTNWNHYAVTWDNGIIKLYFNGTNSSNGDESGTTTALNINGTEKWIGVGVSTHSGTAKMQDDGTDDDYPNHGWLRGFIDDVRIYNRVLSASEIATLVGTEAADVEPSITSGPSDASKTVGQTATFTVTATGTAPLTYQWSWHGTNVADATATSWTTPALVLGNDGSTVTIGVTNSVGGVSDDAILTVTEAPAAGTNRIYNAILRNARFR